MGFDAECARTNRRFGLKQLDERLSVRQGYLPLLVAKSSPVSARSLRSSSELVVWLLADVSSGVLRELVEKVAAAGLSLKSIINYSRVVKMVVAVN